MEQEDILRKPLVAIVILTWNGKKFLEQFLPSLLTTTYQPVDIYVADNASTDDTVDFLNIHYAQIKVISIHKNEGFANGYNIALKQVIADYYILLNQDIEITQQWIEPIISVMEADENIAACQPKILSYINKNCFEHAGAGGGYIDKFGYIFCKGRIFDSVEMDEGQYENIEEVFWASGAAMFVRAELFHRFKGLDGDLFAHMEEIDFCWRLKRAGYKVVYVPQSIVYHVGGGSLPKENPRKTYLNFRNNLSMLFKNLEYYELVWKLPLRLLLEMVAFFKALLQGKFQEACAIFKADWHFIFSLPRQIRKRWENYKIYNCNRINTSRVKEPGYYTGSIVWQYFIMKNKKFSDLK